jgi:hypothetical protein
VLGQAAGLPVPASPESLTTALASTGWSPAGATTTPFCRTWALGGARAVVATAGSGAFLDVVPYTIAPGWDNPEFRAAVESDFATELDRLRSVAAAALAAVAERRPEAVPEGSGTSDFLESRQWDVRDWRLSVGIDYVDEDLPIMVVARLEPR